MVHSVPSGEQDSEERILYLFCVMPFWSETCAEGLRAKLTDTAATFASQSQCW